MKTKVFILSFCVVSFLISFPLISNTEAKCLRCQGGQELACTGETKFDFISKCGSPDYSEEVAEQTSGNVGRHSVDVTTEKIEVMSYNCGSARFIELVKVKGGNVISITSGARGSGPLKCE